MHKDENYDELYWHLNQYIWKQHSVGFCAAISLITRFQKYILLIWWRSGSGDLPSDITDRPIKPNE